VLQFVALGTSTVPAPQADEAALATKWETLELVTCTVPNVSDAVIADTRHGSGLQVMAAKAPAVHKAVVTLGV
jgi:hypothetical protein